MLEDAEEIFRKYAQDPEVTKYLTWRPNQNVQETHDFVRACLQAWDDGKSFHWVVVRKEDQELLGMITARADDHKWELGYVLARPYWGKGYMTEVVKKLVDCGVKQEGIYRVWSVCDVDNLASARVMERAGMQREESCVAGRCIRPLATSRGIPIATRSQNDWPNLLKGRVC